MEKQLDLGLYSIFLYSIPFRFKPTLTRNVWNFDAAWLIVVNAFGVGFAISKRSIKAK
jgi:hypothetical protein